MNNAQQQRLGLGALHKLMVSLLLDTREYNDLVSNPANFAQRHAPNLHGYASYIGGINMGGLNTFRGIVRGTKYSRYEQIFSELKKKLPAESVNVNLLKLISLAAMIIFSLEK